MPFEMHKKKNSAKKMCVPTLPKIFTPVTCNTHIFYLACAVIEVCDTVGRALDCGSKGCKFETHQSHYVVILSKTLNPLLSTGSTQEDRKSA